jgi:uncharacterized protein
VNIRNKSEGKGGATPLHSAAFWDRYEIAKYLLNNGADVNVLDQGKWTPLDEAKRLDNLKLAKLLEENGGKTGAELKTRNGKQLK